MKIKNTLIVLSSIAALFPTSVNALPWRFSQSNSNYQQVQKSQTSSSFRTTFRPPNKGQPKHTVGGATRGDSCTIDREDKNEITALVPAIDQSLTLQAHPSFFAYVSPINGEKSATLIVKDETEDYYYSQKLMIPATGGVIKMTLAEDAPPLEVGQNYTWFLRIQCNAFLQPADPQISASVTRVERDVPSMSQDELVFFYANSEIWYDSLNSAFELSQSGRSIYWSQLLSNIGMERFVTQ